MKITLQLMTDHFLFQTLELKVWNVMDADVQHGADVSRCPVTI